MSKIWINDKGPYEGTFSFEVSVDETKNPAVYIIEGVLECGIGYFDDIKSIANERYRVDRVHVFAESYGSEEDKIIYSFRAGDYGMRNFDGDDKNG